MPNQDEVKEFIHLLTETLTKEDIARYPTIGKVKVRLSEILGRPIFTHELAYPEYLIAELLGEAEYSSFRKATEELEKRMPVMILEIEEK